MNACQEYISDAKSECIKAILEVCPATPTAPTLKIVVGVKQNHQDISYWRGTVDSSTAVHSVPSHPTSRGWPDL